MEPQEGHMSVTPEKDNHVSAALANINSMTLEDDLPDQLRVHGWRSLHRQVGAESSLSASMANQIEAAHDS